MIIIIIYIHNSNNNTHTAKQTKHNTHTTNNKAANTTTSQIRKQQLYIKDTQIMKHDYGKTKTKTHTQQQQYQTRITIIGRTYQHKSAKAINEPRDNNNTTKQTHTQTQSNT